MKPQVCNECRVLYLGLKIMWDVDHFRKWNGGVLKEMWAWTMNWRQWTTVKTKEKKKMKIKHTNNKRNKTIIKKR